MEIPMAEGKFKNREIKWLREIDWLELFYLVLFTAFVIKKYLGTTALEWELPIWYDNVIRGGLYAYIIVRTYEQTTIKKMLAAKEIVLMAAMLFIGEMLNLYAGEIFIWDTILFIIAAKGVDFKKICFVYLCIAVSMHAVALYVVNKGYIPDYIYDSGDRVRHSLGICYPTDCMAQILSIFAVYVCLRGRKITFVEITLMFVGALKLYSYTYARTNLICIVLLCVLCAAVKCLDKFKICITQYRLLDVVSVLIIVLFIACIVATALYDSTNPFWMKLDGVFSQRLSVGKIGYERYGVKLFGNIVNEYGLGFGNNVASGYYFFLDSSYVRVLIKYGVVFAGVLSGLFIWVFRTARRCRMDYMIVALIVFLIAAISEQHLFDLIYNTVWLLAFAKIKDDKETRMKG